jgi:hypothetical protein
VSPEAPGSLVVLTLSTDSDGAWFAEVDRCDPQPEATSWLSASWSEVDCRGLRQPVGGGVVCATIPADFERKVYRAEGLEADMDRLMWRDAAPGEGLMLVAVLPTGWIVCAPNDASRPPVDVKVFKGRFAAYWMLSGRDQIWWRVTRLADRDEERNLRRAVRAFRGVLLDLPQPSPVQLDK